MNNKRKLVIGITVTLFALLFCSCASCKKDDGMDKFEQLIISTGGENEESEKFADMIRMIIPEKCSAELATRSQKLASKIEEKTQIRTIVAYDNTVYTGSYRVLEIFVGNTSYGISKDNLSAMRCDDYICRYDRNSVVIGGVTEEATLAALDRFENEILPGASSSSLMSEYAHFEKKGEYLLNSLTLNGYNIYDYTFVCENSGSQKRIATALRDYIKHYSGYTLDIVVGDGSDINETGKCISFSVDSGFSTAVLQKNGNDVIVTARNTYELSAAAARLAEILLENREGEDSYAVLEFEKIDAKHEIDFSLGFADNENYNDLNYALKLADIIGMSESDVICFPDVDENISRDISVNRKNGYTSLSLKYGTGVCEILYKADSVMNVDASAENDKVCLTIKDKDGVAYEIVFATEYNPGSDTLTVLSGTWRTPEELCGFEFGTTKNRTKCSVCSGTMSATLENKIEYNTDKAFCFIARMTVTPGFCDAFLALENADE